MPFSEGCEVVVEQLDDENWKVAQPFSYTGGQGDTFHVYMDMETDFASVPRAFVWFLPRYGAYTKAAMVHDLLWREYASTGRISYIEADAIFRRAMRELNVPFLRRWMIWAAVRWGAVVKPGGRKGWWREAWRVLLLSVLALPIVVPPAIAVLLALGVFYLVELVCWVPLTGYTEWKQRRGARGMKRVNTPSFDWTIT